MGIRVENLKFAYKDVDVLKGVDFEVHNGEMVHILGRNGAGKTTMFRCILSLLEGYTGKIFLDETDIANMSSVEIAKKIAYIPQSHTPTFNYTVLETVLMGMAAFIPNLSSPKPIHEQEALNILNTLGIKHLANRGYANISGGERQLVLIARALAQKSKILIMDEPTANLDYTHQVCTMRKIKQLSQKGYLVILSTHNPEQAMMYASKVIVLKGGKVNRVGEPNKIITKEMMKEIYDLDVDLIDVPNTDYKSIICIPK